MRIVTTVIDIVPILHDAGIETMKVMVSPVI